MRMETVIRKALRLKAHTVVKVEEDEGVDELVVQLDRLGHRRLQCGACGLEAQHVAPTSNGISFESKLQIKLGSLITRLGFSQSRRAAACMTTLVISSRHIAGLRSLPTRRRAA